MVPTSTIANATPALREPHKPQSVHEQTDVVRAPVAASLIKPAADAWAPSDDRRQQLRGLMSPRGQPDSPRPSLLRLPTERLGRLHLTSPASSRAASPSPDWQHPGRVHMAKLEQAHNDNASRLQEMLHLHRVPTEKRFLLSFVGNQNSEGAWLGDYLGIPRAQQLHIKVCGYPYKTCEAGFEYLNEHGSSLRGTRKNRAKVTTNFDDAAVVVIGHIKTRPTSPVCSERLVAKLSADDFISQLMEHDGQRFAPKYLAFFVCNSATFGRDVRDTMQQPPERVVCVKDDFGVNPYPGNNKPQDPLKLYYGFEQGLPGFCEPKTDTHFNPSHLPIDDVFVDLGVARGQ